MKDSSGLKCSQWLAWQTSGSSVSSVHTLTVWVEERNDINDSLFLSVSGMWLDYIVPIFLVSCAQSNMAGIRRQIEDLTEGLIHS